MPIATLTFNLPEEQPEFENASNGWKWSFVCWQLDQYLRDKMKYEEIPNSEYEVLEKTREKIHEIMMDNNLQFE